MTTIDEVMICPKCNSNNTSEYSIDEIEFNSDGTGHYYVDCSCQDCGNHFRLYTNFKYDITSSRT